MEYRLYYRFPRSFHMFLPTRNYHGESHPSKFSGVFHTECHGISVKNVFRVNSTWAKTYEKLSGDPSSFSGKSTEYKTGTTTVQDRQILCIQISNIVHCSSTTMHGVCRTVRYSKPSKRTIALNQ